MNFQSYIKRQIEEERKGIQRKTETLKGKDGAAFLAGYLNALKNIERKVKQFDSRNHTKEQQSLF